MATQNQSSQSILAVDFGSTNTRVIFIDLVDGQYRLVSQTRVRTTLQPPTDDVLTGLGWAFANLEAQTNHGFVDEMGLVMPEENGVGVDELVATSSAGRPLKAVVLGLMPEISISSARRALSGTYIRVADTLSVADQEHKEVQISRILGTMPDVIFVSGGTDGGNTESVQELIRLSSQIERLVQSSDPPMMIYAGNEDLAAEAEAQIEGIQVAANVRPNLGREKLGPARLQLIRAYSHHMERQPGGFDEIAGVTAVGVVPTAQGVSNLLRWLSKTGVHALLVDVGSSTSMLAMGLNDDVQALVHSDLGIGYTLVEALGRIDVDRVQNWLPFPISEDALWDYAYNKSSVHDTLPQMSREFWIEQAIAREIVRTMVNEARAGLTTFEVNVGEYSPMIVAGAVMTETPYPTLTAWQAFDALEPEGFVDLYADPYGVVSLLGAIAYSNPVAAVQVYDNQSLNYIGPSFCASGTTRRGARAAMRIRIKLEDGRVIKKSLSPGELWAAPVAPGVSAEVDVRLGRGLKINRKGRIRRQVTAGTAGIVFDTRGRPLPFVPLRRRSSTYARWWQALAPVPYAEPESAPEVEEAEESYRERQRQIGSLQEFITMANLETDADPFAPEEKKRRRGRRRRRGKSSGSAKEQQVDEPDWDDLINLK